MNELKSPENVEEEKQLKKKCSFPRRKKISELTPEQRLVKRESNIKMVGNPEKLQMLKQKKEGKAQIANGEQEVEIKMLSLKNFWE